MIIFLHGQDSFSSLEKLRKLKKRFQTEVDPSGSSIAMIEGEEVDLAYVRKVILAPALFAKERFVVFKNFLQTKPNLQLQQDMVELLRDNSGKTNDNVMVFWENKEINGGKGNDSFLYNYLIKQKYSQEFKAPTNLQIGKYIRKLVAEQGLEIENEVVNLLIELVGNNMWRVNSELKKLIAYKESGKIGTRDVELLVSKMENENIYQLLDLIIVKDTKGALKFLNTLLLAQESETSILNILKWHVGVIVKIKACLEDGIKDIGEITKTSGLHQFVVKKNMRYAENLSLISLGDLVELMVGLEMDLRKDKAPPQVLLSDFIIKAATTK